VSYNFVSQKEFYNLQLIERVEFNGNLYGISEEAVTEAMRSSPFVVAVCDAHGAKQFREWAERRGIYCTNVVLECDSNTRLRRLFRRFEETMCEKVLETQNTEQTQNVVRSQVESLLSRIDYWERESADITANIKLADNRAGGTIYRARPASPYYQWFRLDTTETVIAMHSTFVKRLSGPGKNAHELKGLLRYEL
jgi:BMFP domain-containing protein YqiC